MKKYQIKLWDTRVPLIVSEDALNEIIEETPHLIIPDSIELCVA